LVKFNKTCNANGNNDYENDNSQKTFDFHNSNKFEKNIEEDLGKRLVRNILNFKQINDNDSKTLIIALRQVFDHLDYSMTHI
jgi:hypothetical protein